MKNGVENEYGEIAQLARARVHTRGVEGSNPPLATYGTLEKSRVLLALWTV